MLMLKKHKFWRSVSCKDVLWLPFCFCLWAFGVYSLHHKSVEIMQCAIERHLAGTIQTSIFGHFYDYQRLFLNGSSFMLQIHQISSLGILAALISDLWHSLSFPHPQRLFRLDSKTVGRRARGLYSHTDQAPGTSLQCGLQSRRQAPG